jgi:hypothetical protein
VSNISYFASDAIASIFKFKLKLKLKNDLVNRLRNVVVALEELSDGDVDPNSPEYPGLARLASDLVKDRYLKHKDKEVRLYTVSACMEIFLLVSSLFAHGFLTFGLFDFLF